VPTRLSPHDALRAPSRGPRCPRYPRLPPPTRDRSEARSPRTSRISDEEIETAARGWQLEIEKAEYEAHRAERQYHAVEPEHRTVAREFERRWNERLVDFEAMRAR